mmetsp:Transcript_8895/g.24026  ORF Transcript_8895/g.24026 Transcript_8895/m.24026 type:complete len:301 (-) Transcript_8895:1312-2214(-)
MPTQILSWTIGSKSCARSITRTITGSAAILTGMSILAGIPGSNPLHLQTWRGPWLLRLPPCRSRIRSLIRCRMMNSKMKKRSSMSSACSMSRSKHGSVSMGSCSSSCCCSRDTRRSSSNRKLSNRKRKLSGRNKKNNSRNKKSSGRNRKSSGSSRSCSSSSNSSNHRAREMRGKASPYVEALSLYQDLDAIYKTFKQVQSKGCLVCHKLLSTNSRRSIAALLPLHGHQGMHPFEAETHQKEASTAAGLPALMAHLQALPWASKVEQSLLPLMRSYQGRAQGCLVTAASRAPCRAPLAVTL